MRQTMRALSMLLGLGTLVVAQAAGPATAAAATPDFPPSMSGYHNYPEMVAEIQQAEADFPDIVHVFSIGKSYQGRDIWAAKISDNVAEDEDEPEVLIDALHHAREHLTTEQALATLRWLTQDYGTDDTVTRLVNTREIYLIFALNPDGMQYDLTGNPFRAWRKNRQPNPGPSVGTDLNRNYGYRFGCCGGSSGSGKNIEYRGAHAFSAPETRAMRDFVQSRVVHGVQQIRTHITLHTNGELILWPYGYTKKNVPPDMTALDQQTFASLGRAMARTNGYTAEQSSDLYITDGDQIDWLYAKYRIFTYTFELFPTEKPTVWADHYPDDSKIAKQTARNRQAILLLIDRAACPYATLGAGARQQDCGPLYDDLEINRGWSRDPKDTDTASSGLWAVTNPAATTSHGPKQLGDAVSGSGALVTGAASGQEGRIERRRRRRHVDPQPPDRAPGRSRELRPADLLLRVRPLRDLDDRRLLPGPGRGGGRHPHRRVRAARGADQPQRLVAIRLGVAGRLRGPDDPSRDRREGRGEREPGRGRGRQHPHPALNQESRPDRWIGTALGGWRLAYDAGGTAVNDVNMPFE